MSAKVDSAALQDGRMGSQSTIQTRHWADYAFAHGGKDGAPFPVDRPTCDQNIAVLTDAARRARIGQNDKFQALRRLAKWDRARRW
jgi:hypothetical protein